MLSKKILTAILVILITIPTFYTLIISIGADNSTIPREEETNTTNKKIIIVEKSGNEPTIKSVLENKQGLLPNIGQEQANNVKQNTVVSIDNSNNIALATDMEKNSYILTLITGDKIIVTEKNGTQKFAFLTKQASTGYNVLRSKNDVFIIPKGVDLNKFSIELFSLKTLYKYQIEYGLKELPLIVKLKETRPVMLEEEIQRELPVIRNIPTIRLNLINALGLRIPLNSVGEAFKLLETARLIDKVTLDHIRVPAYVKTNGEYKPELYSSVPFIGAPYLWSLGYNGTGIKVAVLDTGVDPTHPDFYINNNTNIIAMKSFVDFDFDGIADEPVQDLHGHGTHVASTIAGTGGYISSIKGVAPGASLLIGKVLANEGFGYDSWIINGIEWAINNSANIISMSLGGTAYPIYDPLVDAVEKGTQQGVLFVIAAGNEGPDYFTVGSPGVAESALTVGASSKWGPPYLYLADFSSRGPAINGTLKPDVIAPGLYIVAARANNTIMGLPASLYHVAASGTSMATPHVSGLAALTWQVLDNSGILDNAASQLGSPKPKIIKDVIVETSTDYWKYPLYYGAGVVNATRIAELLNQSQLVIVDPARTEIGYDVPSRTLSVYNPWPNPINLTIYADIIIGNVTGNTPPTLPPNILTFPSNVYVPANNTSSFTVSVNMSALPRLDNFAIILYFNDNTTNTTLARAVIGVDTFREIYATPHSYVTLQVTYNGTPVSFQALAGYYADIDTGYAWVHPVYGYGYGNATLGPLFENSAYYFLVEADLNTTQLGLPADAGLASVHLVITVPSTPTNQTVSIDLASYTHVYIDIPYGYYAEGGAYYSSAMFVQGNFADYWDTTFTLAAPGPATLLVVGDVDYGGYSPYFPLVAAFIYNSGVDIRLQELTHVWVDSYGYINFNYTRPIYGYLRAYSGMLPTTINVNPQYNNFTVINTRSVITSTPVPTDSYTAYWGYNTYFSFPTLVTGETGTAVTYVIDSNDNFWAASGTATAYISSGGSSLTIQATDYLGSWANATTLILAPLTMPRGFTMWPLTFAYPGLDGYNFTGTFTQVHIFRSSFFGTFSITPTTTYPVFNVTVILNGENKTSVTGNNAITAIDAWYAHHDVPSGYPEIQYHLSANLTAFNDTLSFLTNTAYMDMNITTYIPYNSLYYLSYAYIGYNYGLGIRDIYPLTGYDYLLNMIPAGNTALIAVLFNMPTYGNITTTNTTIYLVDNLGNMYPAPIIAWDFTSLPVALAFVLVDATTIPPGKYGMLVNGLYEDSFTATEIPFELYVDPAFYIGMPPGTPNIPVFHISLTNSTGGQLTNITSGSLVNINIKFDLGSLAYIPGYSDELSPGEANLTVSLLGGGQPSTVITLPLDNTNPMEFTIQTPWDTQSYAIRITLTTEEWGVVYDQTYP